LLESLDVEYVVDVEQGGKKADFLAPDRYVGRPMCDFGSTTISTILTELLEFISAVKEKKSKVLVQCEWGINRSTTVTVAYLMRHENFSLRDALKLCLMRRPCTRPRDAYIEQLMRLEREWRPNLAANEYFSAGEVKAIYGEL